MSGFYLLEKRYFCPPIACSEVPPDFPNPDDRPIKPKIGNYDIIEETEEEHEKESIVVRENNILEEEKRPKSKTKFEKDRENMISKAEKQKERDKNIALKELKDKKNSSKVEKELIIESDSNTSSNWVTESEASISNRSEKVVNQTLEKLETENEVPSKDAIDDKDSKDSDKVPDSDSVNESDDGQVVVINSETTERVSTENNSKEPSEKTSTEEGHNEATVTATSLKRKAGVSKAKGPTNERSRGNIPSSTGRSILRSHSGTWRKLGRRQKQSKEKISTSLPSEEPFQPNLIQPSTKEAAKPSDDKVVELPKLPPDQLSTSSSTPIRNRSPSSPPLPPVRTPGSPPSQPGSTRVSRSIEHVISKLDRRSMSVLPQIGKSSPDECSTQSVASSRASSADRSAEKRTISMTFPYTPLSQIEGQLAVTPPSPRKRWKKVPPGAPPLTTISSNY